jgi:DoxX-like family
LELAVFIAYLVVTLLAAAANIFSAMLDFIRYKQILINMARVGVPESWITMLGILKAAGAIGLLVGIGMPLIGTAAAVGLILFFVGAIITHLRVHDYSFGLAVAFLLLAVAALVLRLATS